MSSLTLTPAIAQAEAAIASVPPTVPDSWRGSAATACQGALDEVLPALHSLQARLAQAEASLDRLNALTDASGGVW